MELEPTLGLEVHVELKTKTKMFCDCLNNPDEKIPNVNICPICLGHPGTLPVINKDAVKKVIMVGLALNSEIPEYSKFDRKNYFYPDLPKGYQISQYDMPLCKGGELPLFLSNNPEQAKARIKITRIHLEEDTARLIHPGPSTGSGQSATLIDFNRAGIPLMELVTEPVIHTSKEARLFAQGLQIVLKTLGVSEADMEKGQMRCEVNISLAQSSKFKTQGSSQKLGTKVEIKNLNSFRAVEKAIDFEIQRQKEILEKGEKVVQETRGWDAEKEITYSQRWKEEAQDYRYFPDPDLPILHSHSKTKAGGIFNLEELKKQMPEMPWQKQERMKKIYGFSQQESVLFVEEEKLAAFFELVMAILSKRELEDKNKIINLVKNYLVSDLKGFMETEAISWDNLKIKPADFAQLIALLAEEKISSRVAKDILMEIARNGGEPEEIIKRKGLEQIKNADELEMIVSEIIKNNSSAVEDYKNGKTNVIQFLVGQTMAKTKGAADPKIVEKLMRKQLES